MDQTDIILIVIGVVILADTIARAYVRAVGADNTQVDEIRAEVWRALGELGPTSRALQDAAESLRKWEGPRDKQD